MLYNMVSTSPVYPAPLNLSTNGGHPSPTLTQQQVLASTHAHALLMENLMRERRAYFERTLTSHHMAYAEHYKLAPSLSPMSERDAKEDELERSESPAKPHLKFGVSAILSSAISPKSEKRPVSPISPQASPKPTHLSICDSKADVMRHSNEHLTSPGAYLQQQAMFQAGCCAPRPMYGSLLQPMARHPYFANPAMLPLPNAFSLLSSMRGKPRRGMLRRAVFSDAQRKGLEEAFQKQKYISKPDRKKLGEKLGLKDSQVKIWFQNRRMKWRNSKERELLSSGGTRDSTLPTRDNPNPDLSDVRIGAEKDNESDTLRVPTLHSHPDSSIDDITHSDISITKHIDDDCHSEDSSDEEDLDVS